MGNGGDEALLASLLQMLPDRVEPIVLSGNPAQTHDRYGVVAVNRKQPIAVLNSLRRSQLFIWGGGSLMQDSTSAANPIYYGGLMKLAQLMGLTTIAWAQGIGPLQRPWVRQFTRHVLAGCTAISVRDEASAHLLATWGLSHRLAPDPVWAMMAASGPRLEDLPAPRIVVNLRRHPLLTEARLATLTQALVLFQQASQASLILVPFQASQDLAIAQHLQSNLPQSRIVQVEDPAALKGLFGRVDLTIAMRLHGLIMAAAEGSRCFALSYDPKVTQLMRSLDLPGGELEQLPIDPQQICQTWLDQLSQGVAVALEQRQTLVEQALAHRDLLHQVAGNHGQ